MRFGQNWLNMFNALLVHLVTLRWVRLREILNCYPAIEQSRSLLDLDYETLWSRPLRDVRRELDLPDEGFTPTDDIEAILTGEESAAAR